MKSLSRDIVDKVYLRLTEEVLKKYRSGRFEDALDLIVTAATWMYHFNTRYVDPQFEEIVTQISEKSIPKVALRNTDADRICVIDYFGLDNRGLTQQYLRGLISLNKEILYILHNDSPIENSEIIKELKEYKKAEICIIKENRYNLCKVAADIAKVIVDFSTSDIMIHIAPWDVVTLMALAAVEGPVKYNINLTDHAYWLGVSFVDYNIEFRGYGELVSLQKRNFGNSQLINLPYYPIISKYSKFKGFPELPRDAVVVLCGGAEYKMLGKDGIFFTLMDTVLSTSPDVHILVAGISDDSIFSEHVNKMKHKDRVHLIGNRSDINEVFAHSDIFLSSYPFIGGLMTQYAAYNRLPILAYAELGEANLVDPLVNHFREAMSSKKSLLEFEAYAKKLIEDKNFRQEEGNNNFNAMMNGEIFGQYLDKVMTNHTTDVVYKPDQPNYDNMVDFYLENENQTHKAFFYLVSRLNFRAFAIAPDYSLDICSIFFQRLKIKLRNH